MVADLPEWWGAGDDHRKAHNDHRLLTAIALEAEPFNGGETHPRLPGALVNGLVAGVPICCGSCPRSETCECLPPPITTGLRDSHRVGPCCDALADGSQGHLPAALLMVGVRLWQVGCAARTLLEHPCHGPGPGARNTGRSHPGPGSGHPCHRRGGSCGSTPNSRLHTCNGSTCGRSSVQYPKRAPIPAGQGEEVRCQRSAGRPECGCPRGHPGGEEHG